MKILRGGAAALHILIAGGEILRTLPECFDEWIDMLWTVASHGNAGLVVVEPSAKTLASRSTSFSVKRRLRNLS